MMKRRGVAVACAAAVVALGSGGVAIWQLSDGETDAPEVAGVTIVSTTTTTQSFATTTVPPVEPYASLAAILPDQLEDHRIDTGAKATGMLDLAAAVAAESDTQAERALLETRQFQGGYARAFTNDQTDVYMVAYDFAKARDAELYLADGFITLYGKGASTYDVAEIPKAKGFSQGMEVEGRPVVVHGVGFAKADRFVLVFTRSAATSTPATAQQLASMLYSRA